jgi:hypothetical protein
MFPDDIWAQIFDIAIYQMRSGSFYKSLIFTILQLQKIGYTNHTFVKSTLANQLWTLVKLISNENKWCWNKLTINPSITMEIVFSNLHLPWSWHVLVVNPNITWHYYQKLLQIYELINKIRALITKIELLKRLRQSTTDIFHLQIKSIRKKIKFINPDNIICGCNNDTLHQSSYDIQFLSLYMPWDVILENIEEKWNWHNVSKNKNITWDIIQLNPYIPWDYYGIIQNPNITADILEKYLHIFRSKLEFHSFSQNSNMTLPLLLKLDLPWNQEHEYSFQYQTLDIIEYIINKYEYWNGDISQNSNITIEFIRQHINVICWYELSSNAAITWDIIQANRDLPWSLECLSANPNITFDIIAANPQIDWNFYKISCNLFKK